MQNLVSAARFAQRETADDEAPKMATDGREQAKCSWGHREPPLRVLVAEE